ncbi:MAG: DUF2332 domain-containing protein [Terricaulis sp.]
MSPILAHFREQAIICAEYGSPFTGELLARMADDIEAGGPVANLVRRWPSNPRADVLSLRLAGALHAAALTGRDAILAAIYPTRGGRRSMGEIWPPARAFLERERDWVSEFITSAPQTNEIRRSIALLAGFLAFAKDWRGPIDMLELGASAGLNLYWDRFAYETKSWSWGNASSAQIDTDWHGPAPPVEVAPAIRHRAGCDLNPLDIGDADAVLRLKSYIWPDQNERLARFDGAVSLARAAGVQIDRASADAWLADKLAARAGDAATIVYHSVFLQYPPRETRKAIIAAIREAGARATPQAPLAWVRLEPEALTDRVENGLRFVLDLHTWPGGERRILGYTDGHVRAFYAR